MSKQRSIRTEYTVWCNTLNSFIVKGHEGYAQSNGMDRKEDFIKAVEGLGWKWIKDDWHCPACAKESGQ